jgi:predicted metal-dependent enzyme (double-stranded beta helix superfamily)
VTSQLLDPRHLTSGGSTRDDEITNPPGQVDRVTDAIEMNRSKRLAIARELTDSAQKWPGMKEPTQRVWALMAASQGFEAWVIGWPPGGAVDLHDHGESSGAVVVVHGELVEIVVAEDRQGTLAATSAVLPVSTSVTFGPAHVHEIVILGSGPAISVHVYAPRLTAMTYYEFGNGILDPRRRFATSSERQVREPSAGCASGACTPQEPTKCQTTTLRRQLSRRPTPTLRIQSLPH